MAAAKTTITQGSVEAFIAGVEPPAKREEAQIIAALMARVTGEPARMWGAAIIGYGEYRTTYESGRAVHWMRSGFSPRKAKHTFYLQSGYCDDTAAQGLSEQLARLGKHKTGKSCLYVNTLAEIDMAVLEEIIAADWAAMQALFPEA